MALKSKKTFHKICAPYRMTQRHRHPPRPPPCAKKQPRSDWAVYLTNQYHRLVFLGPTAPRKVYCHTSLGPKWRSSVEDDCTSFLENLALKAAMKTLHLPRLRQGHEVLAACTPCSAGVLPSVVHDMDRRAYQTTWVFETARFPAPYRNLGLIC